MRYKFSLFIVAALCCAFPLKAQISMRAFVDKDTITLKEHLNFRVEVSGYSSVVSKPTLPSLPNFNIYSSGQSQNVSIINGKVSSSVTYNYTLTPRFTGKAVIKSVILKHKGKTYKTEPIEVIVVRDNSKKQNSVSKTQTNYPASINSEDAFLTARVNKKSVFTGEQIILSVRFYHPAYMLGNPSYVPPALDNFITEDLPPHRSGIENINGKDYQYVEIKTALFAALQGAAKIGPAEVSYRVRTDSNLDPFNDDFISQFFSSGGALEKTAVSKPIAVKVKPLPKVNIPQGFGGAVGKFKIEAVLDKETIKTGELANLTVKIYGSGNLKTIKPPTIPATDNLNIYDTVSSLDISKKNDTVSGVKIFKTVISPEVEGSFIIAPITFSYFNPTLKKYIEIKTKPIRFTAIFSEQKDSVKYNFADTSTPQLTKQSKDINYIKSNLKNYKKSLFLNINSLGKINYTAPLILLIGFCVYLFRLLREKNPYLFKSKAAYSKAKSDIKYASKLFDAGRFDKGFALASGILTSYICAKLKCPFSNISVVEVLEKNYPDLQNIIRRVQNFYKTLDALRFAPVSNENTAKDYQLLQELADILKVLEKEIKV